LQRDKPPTAGTASSKPLDKRLNQGQTKKLLTAVDDLREHLTDLLPAYAQAKPAARAELRAHCPVLDALLAVLESNGVSV
jgi:hypothetical protein